MNPLSPPPSFGSGSISTFASASLFRSTVMSPQPLAAQIGEEEALHAIVGNLSVEVLKDHREFEPHILELLEDDAISLLGQMEKQHQMKLKLQD
ncbi:hypothetical protein PIB30_071728 [Stylosanthes scabra]|uniref:Uncharacterized protein n=1 Tax=Stylosanthes scabra TaxID=79078 RepID=A0ABU6TNJ6_9FABA|nr:hypothetical protein [Stylosanthes scabra]